MQYSDLRSDAYFLCGATSATYLTGDVARNINVAYNDVARQIWEVADGWQYDDSNATTLPIATATLVTDQQDYSLPTTAQRVEALYIKDSSGNRQKLKQIDPHDLSIAPSEFLETAGMPAYYDLIGRSVMLYPKPSSTDVTLSAGMQIYLSRDVTEFAASATTTEPGFAKPFHRILSYAAAIDFTQDERLKESLLNQKARLEQGLVRFYSKRNVERRMSVRPAGKRTWRKYT